MWRPFLVLACWLPAVLASGDVVMLQDGPAKVDAMKIAKMKAEKIVTKMNSAAEAKGMAQGATLMAQAHLPDIVKKETLVESNKIAAEEKRQEQQSAQSAQLAAASQQRVAAEKIKRVAGQEHILEEEAAGRQEQKDEKAFRSEKALKHELKKIQAAKAKKKAEVLKDLSKMKAAHDAKVKKTASEQNALNDELLKMRQMDAAIETKMQAEVRSQVKGRLEKDKQEAQTEKIEHDTGVRALEVEERYLEMKKAREDKKHMSDMKKAASSLQDTLQAKFGLQTSLHNVLTKP